MQDSTVSCELGFWKSCRLEFFVDRSSVRIWCGSVDQCEVLGNRMCLHGDKIFDYQNDEMRFSQSLWTNFERNSVLGNMPESGEIQF